MEDRGLQGPAQALRHGLGHRQLCLGEDDGELLAAETGRNVEVAHVLADDVADPLQHHIAGQVTVAVVDVPEQIQVGHDQGQGAVKPLGPLELFQELLLEIGRIGQPGLGIGLHLFLQLGHHQGPVDQHQGRQAGEHQPGIQIPQLRQHIPHDQHGEVGVEVLQFEDLGLLPGDASGQHQHLADESMVHQQVHDGSQDTGNDQVGQGGGGHHGAQGIVGHLGADASDHMDGDVEGLNVPISQVFAVGQALVDPLQEMGDQDEQHEEEGWQDHHPEKEEDGVGVVGLVPELSLQELGHGRQDQHHGEDPPLLAGDGRLWEGQPCQHAS